MHKIAALQMVSTPDVATNLATARRLAAQAVSQGAELVLLPEYWALMSQDENRKLDYAECLGAPVAEAPIQACLAEIACEHQVWIVGGTLPLVCDTPGKVRNTTLVYDPQGQRVGRYDKIHLFGFSQGAERYDEAGTIEAGDSPSSFESPFGRVGLSICYDLRFPELYRALGECSLIVVPAAFTCITGKVHWEILLRARAIENQAYVLAAAQGGEHDGGRRTWGHSMLVDPWGEVHTVLEQGEGVVSGVIDLAFLEQVRASLPTLQHRKL